MNTYKVTNITDKLGKRHPNYNSTLNIMYVDQMERKTMNLAPNKTVYFTATSLPLSLHRFRIKNLVSISEITEQQLLKLQKQNEAPPAKEKKPKATKKVAAAPSAHRAVGLPADMAR